MTQLLIASNQVGNPISLDLTNYMNVNDESMDTASPSFTDKVITHSLLKAGGVLALTDLKNKELVFPLSLNAATEVALGQLVIEINQILEANGATAIWTEQGAQQPTTFDLIGGQFDIEYSYRKAGAQWLDGKLRLFTQPFGRTAGPRFYAAASGIGPLLMISPYTATGATGIGATTVGGVPGYGGKPAGASTGVFYASPPLQGDAPALLQISYAGPQPAGASNAGVIPTVAISVLPDATYVPLIGIPAVNAARALPVKSATVIGSQYLTVSGGSDIWSFQWPGLTPPATWAGNHRLFAIARASQTNGILALEQSSLTPLAASATVELGDWGVYDLGVLAIGASMQPQQAVNVLVFPGDRYNDGSALDVASFVMLPDFSTWFENPGALSPSQYGVPTSSNGIPLVPGATPADTTGVAVDGTYIYWANGANNSIGRALLNGTGASGAWITGAAGPFDVAVNASSIYWTNFGNGTIGRANLNGSSPSQSFISGASNPAGIAIDGTYVYWANNNLSDPYIGRALLNGTSPSQAFITMDNPIGGLAVGASNIYWTSAGDGTIGRANLNGTSPSQSWMTGLPGVFGITADSNYLYWGNLSSIGRANLNGTSPSQNWLPAAQNYGALAVDSDYLYWPAASRGIFRANKTTPIIPNVAFSNTLFVDDLIGQQSIYANGASNTAPSPVNLQSHATPISPFSRGVIPQPDPKLGLPIIAILGIAQNSNASQGGQYYQPGASWANPQNLATYAQVNVVERTRYVLP